MTGGQCTGNYRYIGLSDRESLFGGVTRAYDNGIYHCCILEEKIGGTKKERRKLCLFLLSFFVPPISPVFELCQRTEKERLRRRLAAVFTTIC